MTGQIRLSLRAKLVSFVVIFIVVFVSFSAITITTLQRFKVDGPVYHQIVDGKDLVADVLPPPMYIIEPYLVALEMLAKADEQDIRASVARSQALRREFEERQRYWKNRLPDGPAKTLVLNDLNQSAYDFFTACDEQYTPLIKAGEKEKATRFAQEVLAKKYVAQREIVDRLVKMLLENDATLQSEAAGAIKGRISLILIVGIIAGLGFCVLAWAVTRSITGPINKALDVLTSGAHQISSASSQVSSASQSLAQGASEQASSLEETSSALEEMASMTRQNADNANQANTMAKDANTTALAGVESMKRMSEAIDKIKNSASETAKIIKTIDEIAFQTNLLALNAAVEAARAGEAGKGFAVVAEEVRNLARRSAEAAKNTADLIEGATKNAEAGVSVTERSRQKPPKDPGSGVQGRHADRRDRGGVEGTIAGDRPGEHGGVRDGQGGPEERGERRGVGERLRGVVLPGPGTFRHGPRTHRPLSAAQA